MSKKQIYKPRPVSGFPEWLPEERFVEQQWFDHIRKIFESYSFCSIETPSVEELDVIKAKGDDGQQDVDKEVYVLERLHKDDDDKKEARLALHFDQTIPLARYVAQHFNNLVFPFKRYQIQRVWRGERPQAGRFREFYQCDIDVINVDSLPLHFDAEMPAIMWEILSSLPGMENENIQIRISNRKILIGLLEGLSIENPVPLTRIVDKLDKIGHEKVADILKSECMLNNNQTNRIMDLVTEANLNALTPESDLMQEGLEELSFVQNHLAHLPEGAVKTDLSIVRGLDYYTGTVYETVFTNDPDYGSICSGGRYDDLASAYINKALPGVGISIGFSRLFDRLRKEGKLPKGQTSPAQILVVIPNEELREIANNTAHTLRSNGYNVEVFHSASKLKRQLAYAEKKNIPYVWFPPFKEGQPHEVKNMETGDQKAIAPENWSIE